MKYKFTLSPISKACLLATALTSSFAHSNESNEDSSIERIQVSADIIERDLSQLPASVTVIQQEDIESRQARHIQDLIAVLPNVNLSSGASRGRFIQIRGIGERSQFSEPTNPSVGLLVDELDISGLGALMTTFDLQQIELLSGPQSVASGVNSLAGVLKLVSNSSDATSFVTASFAEYSETQFGVAAGQQLTDTISARVNFQNTQSDGFVENAFLNRDDTNGIDETTARIALDLALTESTAVEVKYYHFDIDNGYDAFSLDNDNVTQSDQPGFDRADADAFSLKFIENFSDMTLQASISQIDGDFDYGYDEDWTFDGFHPSGYTSFDRYLRQVERTRAEVKLGSYYGSGSTWLIGATYYKNDEALLREYTFSGDFTSTYDPTSVSIFGQYSDFISDNVKYTLAARAESFEADYVDSDGFIETLDDDLFAFSASIDYRIESALLFANVTRGYKAGGFNIDQRLSGDNRTFKPEYNWNYELGVKGDVFDGVGTVAVTAFYMSREDAQVNDFATFEETIESGSVITSFADAIRNTDSGTNKGIEVTSQWYLSDAWQINANLGLLRATFGNYEKLDGSFVPRQDQAQAPTYSIYLSSNYQFTEALSLFIDIDAKDDYRFSDGHNVRAPFTVVVNATVDYQWSDLTLSLWVKNLFDRDVFTRGFGSFSNDPRDEYLFPEPYFQFGQERQIGLTATYNF